MEINSNNKIEKISLLAATRKRPKRLLDMWNSFMNNASNKDDIELVLSIDEDDTLTLDSVRYFPYYDKIKIITQPRTKYLSSLWDRCFSICSGDILVNSSDDILMRTKNWDEIMRETFSRYDDKIVVIHCKDGINNATFCASPVIHRRWVEAVGYIFPPIFTADFGDTWVFYVSSKIGRIIYTPSIYMEHMHFASGKSECDEVYAERRKYYTPSLEQLYDGLLPQRENDVAKLLNFINNFKK
jgi:hypothetical protein